MLKRVDATLPSLLRKAHFKRRFVEGLVAKRGSSVSKRDPQTNPVKQHSADSKASIALATNWHESWRRPLQIPLSSTGET